MSKKPQIIKELEAVNAKIERLINLHSIRLTAVYDQIARLERAGLAYANPHWKANKYFYLVHTVTNGQRKREYIGTNKAKIDKALASVERAKQHKELTHQKSELERHLTNLKSDFVKTLNSFTTE